MNIYLYILKSLKDTGFYIGISKDPKIRLQQHNSKKEISTKSRVPFELIVTIKFENYKEARKLEKTLKSYTTAKINQFITKATSPTCPN